MRSPTQTLRLSTTRTCPLASAAATIALWWVPESLDDNVTITASSPAAWARASACEKA